MIMTKKLLIRSTSDTSKKTDGESHVDTEFSTRLFVIHANVYLLKKKFFRSQNQNLAGILKLRAQMNPGVIQGVPPTRMVLAWDKQ